MRHFTVSAYQYQQFVYPPVASSAAKNLAEWDVCLRVMKKLKDPALTAEIPAPDGERAPGTYAFRQLLGAEATFKLEEDEAKLVQERLQDYKTHLALAAAEDFDAVVRALTVVAPD